MVICLVLVACGYHRKDNSNNTLVIIANSCLPLTGEILRILYNLMVYYLE